MNNSSPIDNPKYSKRELKDIYLRYENVLNWPYYKDEEDLEDELEHNYYPEKLNPFLPKPPYSILIKPNETTLALAEAAKSIKMLYGVSFCN